MTTHEIHTDLTVDPDTGDHAYRAFCECGWADPEGWHHSDTDDEDAVAEASAEAREAADDHTDNTCPECGERNDDGEGFDGLCGNCADRAEQAGRWDADEAEPAPDTRLLQALPIPTTDQGGYALPDAAL